MLKLIIIILYFHITTLTIYRFKELIYLGKEETNKSKPIAFFIKVPILPKIITAQEIVLFS